MKWIVQLDYEFGEFEPNSIYFRRVCSDDMEYGSAYDTKREALEAFCQGQYAINQLRKEREAEQKEEAEQKKVNQTIIYPNKMRLNLEVEKAIEDKLFERFEKRLNIRFVALEERLTEIEGVLSSIGSPEWDLRKKVAELEEWRIRHLMIFHDKPLTEEQQKKADKLFLEQMNK